MLGQKWIKIGAFCEGPRFFAIFSPEIVFKDLHGILYYTTPHYTTPHRTSPHYTTLIALHYTALHYITLHSLHHHKCNCNYTTLITLHHNYNSTTLQLQLQLHYTTLHPAVVGEVTDQVTTAPIAATRKKTQPQPPFGPSVDSLCHP